MSYFYLYTGTPFWSYALQGSAPTSICQPPPAGSGNGQDLGMQTPGIVDWSWVVKQKEQELAQ